MAFAQDAPLKKKSIKPYSIHATIGGPFYNHCTFAAEFSIPSTNNKFRVKPFISLVSRDIIDGKNNVESTTTGVDLVYLLGNTHSLEISAGIQTAIDNKDENQKLGTKVRANLGYRLSYKSIIVRTGLGIPDVFYAGFGFQF